MANWNLLYSAGSSAWWSCDNLDAWDEGGWERGPRGRRYMYEKWNHSVVSDSLRPMGCSLPGSSLHGILQVRILEWVAISFARGSFYPGIKPGSPALQADTLTSEPPGKPLYMWLILLVGQQKLAQYYKAIIF